MFKKALSLLLSLMLIVASLSVTVLSVSAADSSYSVVGVEALCGVEWAKSTADAGANNMMTLKDDGTYEKVYTNVSVQNSLELKVLSDSGEYFGNDAGNNIVFNVVTACDVTVNFNPTSKKVTVSGDGVEIPTGLVVENMYAVGAGDGSWLNGVGWDPAGEENIMTKVSEGVYQITFKDVEWFDNYEFKFAANGTWADQWGAPSDGYYIPLNQDVDAACNSNTPNIHLNTGGEEGDIFDITLTIDVSAFNYDTKTGAKMRADVVKTSGDDPEPATTVPATEGEPATTVPATEAEPTTTVAAGNLTVKSTSNFFPEKTATYDATTKELTVDYYLGSEKNLLNTQWTLKYDPAVLSVSDKNTVNTVMPAVGGNGFTLNLGVDKLDGKGLVKGNASNLALYDFSTLKPFVSVIFNVAASVEAPLTTEVNLEVESLTVSKVRSDGKSDEKEEVTLVQDSVVNQNAGVKVWFEEGQNVPTAPTDDKDAPYLTVKATSNYFPEAVAYYNDEVKEVTVTYYFQSPKNVLSTQWLLKYDPDVLSLSSKNTIMTVSPAITTSAIYNLDGHPGEVYGVASNLSLYDFSTLQKFVTIVFDVKDISAMAPVSTLVDLDVQVLRVSKVGADLMTDESEEVTLIDNSIINTSDAAKAINDATVRKTVIEPESNWNVQTTTTTEEEPTTEEQPTAATDATSATGSVVDGGSTADTPQTPVGGNGGNGAVQTGDASMAIIILSVLVSATGAMFFARKRIK